MKRLFRAINVLALTLTSIITSSTDAASPAPWPTLKSDKHVEISWISQEAELNGLATRIARIYTSLDNKALGDWLKSTLPPNGNLEPMIMHAEHRSLIAWLSPPFLLSIQLNESGLRREGILGLSRLDATPLMPLSLTPADLDLPLQTTIVFQQHENFEIKSVTTLTLASPLSPANLRRQSLNLALARGWNVANTYPSADDRVLTLLRKGRKRFLVFMRARDGPGSQVILVDEHYTRF